MADGRMLRRTVAWDARVAQLSERSALLYLMAIPHLDVDGRMLGHPAAVRGTVAPVLAEAHGWTDQDVEGWIDEWQTTRDQDGHPCPLVWWYSVDGTLVLEFRGFAKNQRLRRDREARSMFPAPPQDLLSEHHLLEPAPVPSGAAAATPSQEPLEPSPVPSGTVAATPPQGNTPAEHSTIGRGYSGSEVEGQGQGEEQAASTASTVDPCAGAGSIAVLLAARFTSIFGRPDRLRAELRPRLERVVAEIGVDTAIQVMEERHRTDGTGAAPGSLAFFLPAFEERAAQLGWSSQVDAATAADRMGRLERWVDQVGWQFPETDLRDELATAFGATGQEIDTLVARASQRGSEVAAS